MSASTESRRSQAIALLGGNGAALVMSFQYVLEHAGPMIQQRAWTFAAWAILSSFAGAICAYKALEHVETGRFSTWESFAALILGGNIVGFTAALALAGANGGV